MVVFMGIAWSYTCPGFKPEKLDNDCLIKHKSVLFNSVLGALSVTDF